MKVSRKNKRSRKRTLSPDRKDTNKRWKPRKARLSSSSSCSSTSSSSCSSTSSSSSSSSGSSEAHRKVKRKRSSVRKARLSSSDSSSSSGSSSGSSSSSTGKKRQKQTGKIKKEFKRKLKKCKKKSSEKDARSKKQQDDDDVSADVPLHLMEKCKAMAPMTKEQWEKQQSVVRKVYDETTGRHRLIKGDGEVVEEVVSKERHKKINQQATKGDGEYFQRKQQLSSSVSH